MDLFRPADSVAALSTHREVKPPVHLRRPRPLVLSRPSSVSLLPPSPSLSFCPCLVPATQSSSGSGTALRPLLAGSSIRVGIASLSPTPRAHRRAGCFLCRLWSPLLPSRVPWAGRGGPPSLVPRAKKYTERQVQSSSSAATEKAAEMYQQNILCEYPLVTAARPWPGAGAVTISLVCLKELVHKK